MSCLLSFYIIERDNNDDTLWAWTYPSVSDKQKAVILRRCSFSLPDSFIFWHYCENWIYIAYSEVNVQHKLPNVKQFAITLRSRDLDTAKYEKLSHIMIKTYLDSGNPATLLQLYLNVVTKEVCTFKENGTFLVRECGMPSFPQQTMVKDLIKLFGLEIIIIYTVLLLKKRLVVYHHNLQTLMQWIQSFPLFMVHRDKILNNFYPWVEIDDELEELKILPYYIAGFDDNAILSRSDLYDVLVNLPAREITVSPRAKDNLAMTKKHKDIAQYMVQLSESDLSDVQVIKAIAEKTQELINQLRAIGKEMEDGKTMVSLQMLKEKNVSQTMESFLFQLALAENML